MLLRTIRTALSRFKAPENAPELVPRERHRAAMPISNLTLECDDLGEAEALARKACVTQPYQAEPFKALGQVLTRRGNLAAAATALEQACNLDPKDASTFYSLGCARFAAGDYSKAAAAFRNALQIRSDWAAAILSLGDCLAAAGDVDGAEDAYVRSLQLDSGLSEAHHNLGHLLLQLGRVEEAITSYRNALALRKEGFSRTHTNLVYALNFLDSASQKDVFQAHLDWAKEHAETLTANAQAPVGSNASGRPLRVGYVSPNFRQHAVSFFFEPVLKYHDPGSFQIYCYSDVRAPDRTTQRLRGYSCVWRETGMHSDEELAELIRNDGIDILVDLTGHTDGDRLKVFARRPAPIQVTWNGYANTTGMSAMDYRITDCYCDPPGATEHLHTERLLRMPEIYMPFETPEDDVAVSALPCIERGNVTFASFNALSKVSSRTIRLWSGILKRVPSARLVLFTVPEGRARSRLLEAFTAHGLSADRIAFRPRLSQRAFLEAHREVDIGLDTYPFHGTTTTAHNLWMGVPVVTLAGPVHASRVGVSMLSNAGLSELIASTEDEYVERAVKLASDWPRLQEMRATLRGRMRAAPNMDGPRFTRALESAYSGIWSEYRQRQSSVTG